MEQLTKNQAVATSQEAVQNQNEPQLRDEDRKSGSAGMPRPISYAVFCLKKKNEPEMKRRLHTKVLLPFSAILVSAISLKSWVIHCAAPATYYTDAVRLRVQ